MLSGKHINKEYTKLRQVIGRLEKLIPDKKSFKTNRSKYLALSKAIKKTNNLKELLNLLENFLTNALYPDKAIISQLIMKLTDYNYFEYAYMIYLDAIKKDVCNINTDNSMISAAGKKGRIDLIWLIYQKTIDSKKYIADQFTHNIMIDAAGKNKRIDLACIAYRKAIEQGIADHFTHTSMINAAGIGGYKNLVLFAYQNAINPLHPVANLTTDNNVLDAANKNGWIDMARSIYRKITDPNNNTADEISHILMVDALFKNNDLEEAKKIYDNNNIKLPVINNNDCYQIDCHDGNFSYGQVYIGLNQLIKDAKFPIQLRLNYGRGLHSKNKIDNESPIKKAVKQFFHDMESNYEIILDEQNPGFAVCKIKEKKLFHKTAFFSAPTPSTDFNFNEKPRFSFETCAKFENTFFYFPVDKKKKSYNQAEEFIDAQLRDEISDYCLLSPIKN